MQFNNKPPETIVFFSILFDPGHNALENIRNANNFGYKSIAYVNRANNSFMADMKSLDVIVLGRNENVGIGVAFSELEDYLKESSINYFIYFDQDTIVKNHAWKYIQNTYKDLFSPPDVGLLFYGSNTSSYSKLVVSSGCLFSMSIIRILGNHNSSFFVEGVDYEFCLRLKNFNYKIRNVYLESIDHLTLQDGNSLEKFGFRFNIRIYGNKRLTDFNTSHIKLIGSSLASGQVEMAILFFKSMAAFNFREFISRVLKRFF